MAYILLLKATSISSLAPGERHVTEGGEALPIDLVLQETSACKGGDVVEAGTRDNGSDPYL